MAARRGSVPTLCCETNNLWSCRVTALSSPDAQNMHYNMQGEFCAGIGWRGWTGIHSVMCSDHTEPACSRCRSLQFPLVNIWRCGELRPRVSFNYSTGRFHVVHTWVQVFLRGRGCLWAFFGFTATAAAQAPKVSLTVNPSDPSNKHRLLLQDDAVMSPLNNRSHTIELGCSVRAAGDAHKVSSALQEGLTWAGTTYIFSTIGHFKPCNVDCSQVSCAMTSRSLSWLKKKKSKI